MHRPFNPSNYASIVNDDSAAAGMTLDFVHVYNIGSGFGDLEFLERWFSVLSMRSLDTLRLGTNGLLIVEFPIAIRGDWLELLWSTWNLRDIRECSLDWFLVFFQCTINCKPNSITTETKTDPSRTLITTLTSVSSSSWSMTVKNESFLIPNSFVSPPRAIHLSFQRGLTEISQLFG